MGAKSIKLPLAEEERRLLRETRIRMSEIPGMSCDELNVLTGISLERSAELIAFGTFQMIPDIGPVMAGCLVFLGYSHPSQLKGKDPAHLLNTLEVRLGYWVDLCVEDQLRLVVRYAEHPQVKKRWWDFTQVRKDYREKHGYPLTRPTIAWDDSCRDAKLHGRGNP